jgi:outer membrane lipopolysaccharide assembly protein LptE/RlpB
MTLFYSCDEFAEANEYDTTSTCGFHSRQTPKTPSSLDRLKWFAKMCENPVSVDYLFDLQEEKNKRIIEQEN